MNPERITSHRVVEIEDEFARLGLEKIGETVRKRAARVIARSGDLAQIEVEVDNTEVAYLIRLYQEMKLNEFLQFRFDKLSQEDKVKWVKTVVTERLAKLPPLNFGMVLSGRGGFALSALFKAYGCDGKVHEVAKQMLKELLGKIRGLFPPDAVEGYLEELWELQKLPQPYRITEERLKDTNTVLKSFFFNRGGNFYVFSYTKGNERRYTFIDAGDRQYRPNILQLLRENEIEPANIERILLTHHHPDHSGLVDILCLASGAKVFVHPNFRNVFEGGEIDESRARLEALGVSYNFKQYVEYFPFAKEGATRNIGGATFPVLGELVDVGEGARLEILGLPQDDLLTQPTHTGDQLLFFYTPTNSLKTLKIMGRSFKPTDEILFSGDLWLMHRPGFSEETMRRCPKMFELLRKRRGRFDFRQQDRQAKDALKKGFSLITVLPAHGEEFLGSRILGTLLAQRDILVKLGFDEKEEKAVLQRNGLASKIQQIKAEAYQDFITELHLWHASVDKGGFGYSRSEISKLLLRIYREQTGGGDLVEADRKERRSALKNVLSKLNCDRKQAVTLRQIARSTLAEIQKEDQRERELTSFP